MKIEGKVNYSLVVIGVIFTYIFMPIVTLTVLHLAGVLVGAGVGSMLLVGLVFHLYTMWLVTRAMKLVAVANNG